MSKTQIKKLPARGARILAAICALVMTACLTLALVSLLGIQIATSRSLHERAALATDVVDRQMTRIEAEVTSLAEEYGFQPATVLNLITRESAENLDRQIIAWWTGLGTDGKLGEVPSYSLEGAEEALRADEAFLAGLDPMMVNNTVNAIVSRVNDIVWRSAAQFRELLVSVGVRFAGDRVSLTQITSLLPKVPVVCGLISLLMAGLIALCMSRRIQTAGQYLGGTLSASGLVLLLGFVLMKILNLRGMIGEASEALQAQFIHLSRTVSLEILGCAAVLLITGGLLMAWAGKEYREA